MPAKKRISKKQQVDGKDHESPKVSTADFNPKSLEDIWGFKLNKFGTNDETEYKKKLSLMNKADMQRACINIGLHPHDRRNIMEDRLLRQFRRHVAAIQTAHIKPHPTPDNESVRRMMANLGGNTIV